jgi:hypothetical protein
MVALPEPSVRPETLVEIVKPASVPMELALLQSINGDRAERVSCVQCEGKGCVDAAESSSGRPRLMRSSTAGSIRPVWMFARGPGSSGFEVFDEKMSAALERAWAEGPGAVVHVTNGAGHEVVIDLSSMVQTALWSGAERKVVRGAADEQLIEVTVPALVPPDRYVSAKACGPSGEAVRVKVAVPSGLEAGAVFHARFKPAAPVDTAALTERIAALKLEAVTLKQGGNLSGAVLKLRELKRLQAQLQADPDEEARLTAIEAESPGGEPADPRIVEVQRGESFTPFDRRAAVSCYEQRSPEQRRPSRAKMMAIRSSEQARETAPSPPSSSSRQELELCITREARTGRLGLGVDAANVVVEVSEGVSQLQVGDHIVAVDGTLLDERSGKRFVDIVGGSAAESHRLRVARAPDEPRAEASSSLVAMPQAVGSETSGQLTRRRRQLLAQATPGEGINARVQFEGEAKPAGVEPHLFCTVCQGVGRTSALLCPKWAQAAAQAADDDAAYQCGVCFGDGEYKITSACTRGHFYCSDCIRCSLTGMLESGQSLRCPGCRSDESERSSEAPGDGTGDVTEECLSYLQLRGVISRPLLFRLIKAARSAASAPQLQRSICSGEFSACPAGCGLYLLHNHESYTHRGGGVGLGQMISREDGALAIRLGECPCGALLCVACKTLVQAEDAQAHVCKEGGEAADPATRALMTKVCKACPGCGMLLQNTGTGCDLMMCGTEAHGSVADALRNGGCAYMFHWDTLEPQIDDHGYTGLDGHKHIGVGVVTERQVLKKYKVSECEMQRARKALGQPQGGIRDGDRAQPWWLDSAPL